MLFRSCFENGALGIALNLEPREIGVVVLGESEGIDEGSRVRRDVRRLGDPGTVLSEKTLADRGVMAITVHGGLIWGQVTKDSTDSPDNAIVKELICWDADSGTEAGAVSFDPQDALLGVNAYGCYNEFQLCYRLALVDGMPGDLIRLPGCVFDGTFLWHSEKSRDKANAAQGLRA